MMELWFQRNTTIYCLTTLLVFGVGCGRSRHEQSTDFVAFSLREAVVHARVNDRSQSLSSLGGITRIAGIVYDKKGKDIILIGLATPELPEVHFDDLVVALRARLRYDEFPLVSIDPVEETQKTGLQRVRFSGHLEDTLFGSDLLNCDILLKQYSLKQVEMLDAVRSFNVLLEDDLKARAKSAGEPVTSIEWYPAEEGKDVLKPHYGKVVSSSESYQARFWFREEEPYYAACKPDELSPEVFCIRKLKLCVRSESIGKESQRPAFQARERFAEQWTEHFDDVCERYPKLRKLKALYDLVAVADVIRIVNANAETQPYFDYLLYNYHVSPVSTDSHYKLQHLYGVVKYGDTQEHLIRISGGIELRPQIKWLNYGNVMQLREIVIESRPSDTSLTWQLPLDGWNMPNAADLSLSEESGARNPARDAEVIGDKPGFSLQCESVVLSHHTFADDDDDERYYGAVPPPPPPPPPPGAISLDRVRRFNGFGPPPPPPPALRGVSMRMVLAEDSFKQDESGMLETKGNDASQSRPDGDSMSWKLKSEGSHK